MVFVTMSSAPIDILIISIVFFSAILIIVSYLYLKNGLKCLDNQEYSSPFILWTYTDMGNPFEFYPYMLYGLDTSMSQNDDKKETGDEPDEGNSTNC